MSLVYWKWSCSTKGCTLRRNAFSESADVCERSPAKTTLLGRIESHPLLSWLSTQITSPAGAELNNQVVDMLQKAGYTVSGNSVVDESGTVAFVQFSGHGYKGNIASVSHFSGAGVTLAGLGTKNVTTITLMPN